MKRFLLIFILMLVPALSVHAREPFDHSVWDQFLKTFVSEDGTVDFEAVQKDRSLLDKYFEALNQIEWLDFKTNWPREEKMALWLNAYHAGIVKTVIDNYPVESINSIPGVWTNRSISFAGRFFSIEEIRSMYLLGSFHDEKIHLALSCGAKSCPPFPKEAFTGPRVEGQLFLLTNQIVNNPEYVQVTPGQKKIFLSRIFKWYANDFILDFGHSRTQQSKFSEKEMAVLSFIAHYLEDAEKVDYLEDLNFKIKYMNFDWSLNRRQIEVYTAQQTP